MLPIINLLNLGFDFFFVVTEITDLWAANILCNSFVVSVICMDMYVYESRLNTKYIVFLRYLRIEFRPIVRILSFLLISAESFQQGHTVQGPNTNQCYPGPKTTPQDVPLS